MQDVYFVEISVCIDGSNTGLSHCLIVLVFSLSKVIPHSCASFGKYRFKA